MTIQEDLKTAMLSKDELRVRTLRMLIAATKNEEILKGRTLTNDELITVIKRLVKQREDSAKMYRTGNCESKASAEEDEITVLRVYLPDMLEGDELYEQVNTIMNRVGATEKKHMSLVMKELKERYGSSFDGRQASSLLNTLLK